MRKLSFEEIEQRLISNNPNLFEVKELSNGSFQATCIKCGGHPIISRHHALRGDTKCNICYNRVVESGINDIATTHPDIAKYYVDTDYVLTHSIGTKEKGLAKCPLCQRTRMLQPVKIREKGFQCQYCSDGISYPNKYIRNLLEQLPVTNVVYEYSPKWAQRKRYDAYFEYQDRKFTIKHQVV